MTTRIGALFLAVTLLLCSGGWLFAQPGPGISDLELQIAALTTLDELDLTSQQLDSLQSIAERVFDPAAESNATTDAPAPTTRPAASTKDYQQALIGLRDALISGNESRILKTQRTVADLRQRVKIAPDVKITLNDEAKRQSDAVVHMLTSGQIATYIAIHANEIPDATKTILDALDESHSVNDEDFARLKEEASGQVTLLTSGLLTRTVVSRQESRIDTLLDKARSMSSDDYNANREQLAETAREITRPIDPFNAVRHWMQREMAYVISNPQVTIVLEARSAALAKEGKNQ